MSTQNNDHKNNKPKWIPHSKIVERLTHKNKRLNTAIQLGSREEKASYLAKITDIFHDEWTRQDNP